MTGCKTVGECESEENKEMIVIGGEKSEANELFVHVG